MLWSETIILPANIEIARNCIDIYNLNLFFDNITDTTLLQAEEPRIFTQNISGFNQHFSYRVKELERVTNDTYEHVIYTVNFKKLISIVCTASVRKINETETELFIACEIKQLKKNLLIQNLLYKVRREMDRRVLPMAITRMQKYAQDKQLITK